MIHNLAAGVSAFSSNAFLVTGDEPALVDAGANFDVVDRIAERTDSLERVVLTHTHRDHVGNLPAVREAVDAPVYGFDPEHEGVDRRLADGDTVRLGDHGYEAMHTPGHKDDHLCLYAPEPAVLFAGDLVFQNGGVGRTDLPEGDPRALVESIDRVRDRVGTALAALHSGHGPSVTADAHRHLELAAQMARRL